MKKIIIVALLLIISVASFSQQTTPSPALTKQDYLKKSNNQKFVAWTLLGGGAIGLAIAGLSLDIQSSFPIVAVGIGAVCIVGSTPFFFASAKNKRRAMSLSFKKETIPQLQNGSFVNRSIPSLTLKINL